MKNNDDKNTNIKALRKNNWAKNKIEQLLLRVYTCSHELQITIIKKIEKLKAPKNYKIENVIVKLLLFPFLYFENCTK